MRKIKSFLKWLFGISVAATCILLIVAWFYIKSEERKLSGANTVVVNTSQFDPLYGKLAIINVNIILTELDSVLSNQTVLIHNEIIEYVGDETEIAPEYIIIDGQGKFLIPGLIDTHIHAYQSPNDLLLYLANGITHVAIMSSWNGLYLEWREKAKQGALSPQIYVAAGPMNTAHDFRSKAYGFLGPIQLFNDPDETKKDIVQFKKMGYDALKAYSLDKANYAAVSEAAKEQNIPMIGHLTHEVSLDDLFNSNQSQVAHVEEITKAMEREFGGRRKIYYDNTEAFLSFMTKAADSVAKRLKERNIAVSTTIDVYPRVKEQDLNLSEYLKSIQLEYLNPGILEGSIFSPGWLPGSNRYEDPKNTSAAAIERAHLYWDTYIESVNIMTRALFRNGVTVTAGTDAGNPGIIPGFSLHDELEQLNAIGLSNQQVLHSATKAAAEWVDTNAGTIEVGRRADMVLLDENPLLDINNTRSIRSVIANGKYLDREQLDNILESVKDANNQSRKVNIDVYLKQ